jgi:hypothetical protein
MGYAAARIDSKLKGRPNKFGWLQAPAILPLPFALELLHAAIFSGRIVSGNTRIEVASAQGSNGLARAKRLRVMTRSTTSRRLLL